MFKDDSYLDVLIRLICKQTIAFTSPTLVPLSYMYLLILLSYSLKLHGTWVLLFFMYCLLVLSKVTLCGCLVSTSPAWLLHSFMYRLLVLIVATLLVAC